MDSEINKLSSTLHNRINNIKMITKYTDLKSRLHFINAYVIGKLNYLLPTYCNSNKYFFNRLHKIQITAAKAVMKDLVMYRCLSYIHGVIANKKTKCIYQIYRQNRFERHKAELTCVNLPKGKKYSTFFLIISNSKL